MATKPKATVVRPNDQGVGGFTDPDVGGRPQGGAGILERVEQRLFSIEQRLGALIVQEKIDSFEKRLAALEAGKPAPSKPKGPGGA
jgi:hypothetical protein